MVSLIDTVPNRTTARRDSVVRVNGTVISRPEIAREVQHHAAATPAQAWIDAARALAIRELLLQEAARLGLQPEPETDAQGRRETDEEALLRALIAHEVKRPEPTEAECRRIFDTQRARFTAPALYEVSHILIPVAAPELIEAARDTAGVLIDQLRGDPGVFAALAKAYSACPSKEVGGSLGQIGPGQTVPEFEAALAALPVGEVAPAPVETRYGLHIVRVERRIAAQPLPFELARPQIARWLAARVYQTAVRQYIGLLAGRARIEGVDIAASPSALVQ